MGTIEKENHVPIFQKYHVGIINNLRSPSYTFKQTLLVAILVIVIYSVTEVFSQVVTSNSLLPWRLSESLAQSTN